MPSTTNFGWTTPADTDLVKDGASAIRTLGNGIDTTLVDLKGGTTGQVLSKNSNTDMDFTWVAQDDSNAIQNALLTTTGDTIYASSASTPARLGIGSSGQVLTVSGGLPTWATPSSGGMTLISTTSLTGTAINLTSIPSTYNHLQLIIRGFRPTTDSRSLQLRLQNDSNTRYRTGYGATTSTLGGSASSFGDNILYVTDNSDNTATTGIFMIEFLDYANTSTWKMFRHQWFHPNATTSTLANYGIGYGAYDQIGAINQINIFVSSSDSFAGGTALLYGVK